LDYGGTKRRGKDLTMDAERTHNAVIEAARATPSVAAIIATVGGLTVEKWLALAGIAFIGVQVIVMVWRHIIFLRRERDRVAKLRASQESEESDSDRAPL
jgi:hypothetical protein